MTVTPVATTGFGRVVGRLAALRAALSGSAWVRGLTWGLVISFGALTGMGVLEFVSDMLARFNTTGIILSLIWQPTADVTGWLIWCWLLLILVVRFLAANTAPRTLLFLFVLGAGVVFLFWCTQAAFLYGSARSLDDGAIVAGIKQSVRDEDVGRYLFYEYAATVDDYGERRNDVLIDFARTLGFIDYHEQALDALMQVNRHLPYNQAYWLLYTGEVVATRNWPYLPAALDRWQEVIVRQKQWDQLAECWNTATLFSPVFGEQAEEMQAHLLHRVTGPQLAIVSDIITEPTYPQAAAFIAHTASLGVAGQVETLWAAAKEEMIANNWDRAWILGRYALALRPHSPQLMMDVAHIALGAGRYREALAMAGQYGPDSAEGAYVAGVASLALGNYAAADAYAASAEQIAKDKGYLELALSARTLGETAKERVHAK